VYENLKKLRLSTGLTQEEFGKSIGVAKSTYNNYETGLRDPRSDFWIAVATKYGVTIDYLMGYSDDPHKTGPATPAPQKQKPAASKPDTAAKIANRDGRLGGHRKRTVCAVVSEEERRIQALQKTDPEDNVIRVHWNNQPASAGEGFDLSDEHMYQWTVRYNELTRKADFCLDVQGHSMEPKFHDGDTVLIRQQPAVDVGEVGLFIVDGKGFIKKQGPDRLISLNPESKDIWPGEYSDVRCVGKVLGVLEPEWIISR